MPISSFFKIRLALPPASAAALETLPERLDDIRTPDSERARGGADAVMTRAQCLFMGMHAPADVPESIRNCWANDSPVASGGLHSCEVRDRQLQKPVTFCMAVRMLETVVCPRLCCR